MNEQIKDGGPAFGQVVELRCVRVDPTGAQEWEPEVCYHGGLSVRDYFAAKAAPALYSELCDGWRAKEFPVDDSWADGLALDAYRIADAMLAARETKS